MDIIHESDIEEFLKNPFDHRISVSQKLLIKYPDRVPVIVGRSEIKNTPEMNRHKYIAPRDFTFAKFSQELRNYIPSLHPQTGLFFFLPNNILPPGSALMSHLYEKHKSNDGFLYLAYACENTFGK